MQLADSSDETLRNLYRLAVLLTGDPSRAESVLLKAVTRSAPHLAQYRDRSHGLICFVKMLLQEAGPPPSSRPDPNDFPSCFASIQEPDRSALALFYLHLLSVEEIAEVLDLDLYELGNVLGHARGHLLETGVSL